MTRTGEEYLAALKDGREVWYEGERVKDVTTHAAFRNTALTLIRRLGYKVVEGFEHFAEHRLAAVEAVRGRRTE